MICEARVPCPRKLWLADFDFSNQELHGSNVGCAGLQGQDRSRSSWALEAGRVWIIQLSVCRRRQGACLLKRSGDANLNFKNMTPGTII